MSNTNTTILTDENGVQREYREVRRKANVGERIKVVDDRKRGDHDFELGEILYVIHDNRWPNSNPNGGVSVSEHFQKARSKFEGRGIYNDRYVVLEPTDIVIIDGVRYREEKRKARVGDLIYYPEDQRFAVVIADEDDLANGDCTYYSTAMKYPHIVLTPINEPQAPTTVAPQVINVNLTITVQPGDDVAQAVADAVKRELTKSQRLSSADLFVKAAESLANEPAPKPKSPQQLRDEVVERAKRDVAELERSWIASWQSAKGVSFWPKACAEKGLTPVHYVEYVVNREKRTVVALVRRIRGNEVDYRGIAKCAPGGVFNSHIGRAIALRRALGLPVPTDYVNTPQPTEVRVGDVVETVIGVYTGTRGTVDAIKPSGFVSADRGLTFIDEKGSSQWRFIDRVKVIDDSREETEVSA
ncbi:hypothetical protein A6764_15150 [Brevibacillus sp. WF146]|uniref:hypothetical protein n=1 Tax=Brevibacillus sp. WF146 TaxID=319501 RepID=UPI0007EDE751|nr:hypothetical protein [Brevibacillus sp. WF146]UYZ12162.1 hypothetical protein A6764_15150 [Brevibacillus sp. WF146]